MAFPGSSRVLSLAVRDARAPNPVAGDECEWCFVKPRPFAQELLTRLSPLYNVYLYTLGSRDYAEVVRVLLDPNGTVIRGVMSSTDTPGLTNVKRLSRLLSSEEERRRAVILDDQAGVWDEDQAQVITARPFDFWEPVRRLPWGVNARPSADEQRRTFQALLQPLLFWRCDAVLLSVVAVLMGLHQLMVSGVDVKDALCALRKTVLPGCRIAFLRVGSAASQQQQEARWRRVAALFGATVLAPRSI